VRETRSRFSSLSSKQPWIRKEAMPGGYGGKPPGIAGIGVPTGARNAGTSAPAGDQSAKTNLHPMGACSVKTLSGVDLSTSFYRVMLDRIFRLELGLLFWVSSAIGKHDRDPRHADSGGKRDDPQR
jgi:hypothetical protein